MNHLTTFLAVLPFLVFIYLLFVQKNSLLKASLATLVLYTLEAVLYWKIEPSFLATSYGKGTLIAVDILLIIFGAIFFLEILKKLKVIKNISYYLSHISNDYRVQVILIAWFFETFLEATAGFGVPAAIAVPLLIGLGIGPIRSLVLGLLGNSTPGVFGAAGTPIKIGYADLPALSVAKVPMMAALFNMVGVIVPVFMMWVVTKGRKNRKKEFLDILPFAVWSGVLFLVPSVLAVSLGQEFPSIIGSIVGMIFVILSIKAGFLMPKENLSLVENSQGERTMPATKAFFPYALLVTFLILGKVLLDGKGINIDLGFVSRKFHWFNPGFAFIVAGLLVPLIWGKTKEKLFGGSMKRAFKDALGPFFVIASILAMVQIMSNSGNNFSGLPSVVDLISRAFETSFLPLLAPFIGAFGGFMTGSVTASSVMFGALLNAAAANIGMSVALILSLAVVGAAAGNMIALADILTAEVVVGVKNKEREILKGVFIPCFTYLALVGLAGVIVLRFFV